MLRTHSPSPRLRLSRRASEAFRGDRHTLLQPSPAHATCYRHQCFTTADKLASHANIPDVKWSVSFQSRLGREPWLKPHTDRILKEFPKRGVKRLLVIYPSFVADNLETLEEISMDGKRIFMNAGGESFDLIPCLNIHESWVGFLCTSVTRWLKGS